VRFRPSERVEVRRPERSDQAREDHVLPDPHPRYVRVGGRRVLDDPTVFDGHFYYYNTETGVTTWDRDLAGDPAVSSEPRDNRDPDEWYFLSNGDAKDTRRFHAELGALAVLYTGALVYAAFVFTPTPASITGLVLLSVSMAIQFKFDPVLRKLYWKCGGDPPPKTVCALPAMVSVYVSVLLYAAITWPFHDSNMKIRNRMEVHVLSVGNVLGFAALCLLMGFSLYRRWHDMKIEWRGRTVHIGGIGDGKWVDGHHVAEAGGSGGHHGHHHHHGGHHGHHEHRTHEQRITDKFNHGDSVDHSKADAIVVLQDAIQSYDADDGLQDVS
jgi:hypothetical protein